jgi:tetratricopeptide (TPR) repeat protein
MPVHPIRSETVISGTSDYRSLIAKTVFALTACLSACLCFAATCATPPELQAKLRTPPDTDSYIQLGTWFGDHRQYNCAVEAFRAGLKLEPGSAQLYYLVGLSLFSSGHADDAVSQLQQSIQLIPEVLKPHLILAMAFDQLHRMPEADAEWEAALKIDPRSIEAFDGLAKSLLAEGNYRAVIALLQTAPPKEQGLALDLSRAYDLAGMLDESANTLQQAFKVNPSSLPLSEALVMILARQAHFEEAAKLAEKRVQLHPRDLKAQELYLHVLVLNDDVKTAQPLARKLLAASPHEFGVLYLNGVLERESGQFPAARKHLEEAIALDPQHYNSRYNLGVVLAELGDSKGAKEQLEKSLELGANEPQVRYKLAMVLRTLGETEQAQEQLKLYQQEEKAKADRTLAASKSAQAAKEFESGDPAKAAALYRDAMAVYPNDAALAYKLAMALDRAGNTDEERSVLEQAVKIDPDFALAQNQLGYLASRGGDTASAEEHFRLAVRASPGYTQAWVSLAATLGMESRFPEAQEAVASALRLDPNNAEAKQLRKDLTAAQAQR